MTTRKATAGQKQIPCGDDKQKGNGRTEAELYGMTTRKATAEQKQSPMG
jgi:hypothetical protein